MKLPKGSYIITAYFHNAHGPGWSNCPLWVLYRDERSEVQELCLQPEDWRKDPVLLALAPHAAAMQGEVTKGAERLLEKP